MYILCQIIAIIIIIIDFNDWASWPVPVQNLLSENYESIQAFGRTPWTGIRPTQWLYLYRTTQTQKETHHASMPRVGFENTSPVFDRPKTIRALNREAIILNLIILLIATLHSQWRHAALNTTYVIKYFYLQNTAIYSSPFLVLRNQRNRPDVALGSEKRQGTINTARYLTLLWPKFEIYEWEISFITEGKIVWGT